MQGCRRAFIAKRMQLHRNDLVHRALPRDRLGGQLVCVLCMHRPIYMQLERSVRLLLLVVTSIYTEHLHSNSTEQPAVAYSRSYVSTTCLLVRRVVGQVEWRHGQLVQESACRLRQEQPGGSRQQSQATACRKKRTVFCVCREASQQHHLSSPPVLPISNLRYGIFGLWPNAGGLGLP